MAHFKWVVERPWPRVPLSENPTAAVVAFWRLDVVGGGGRASSSSGGGDDGCQRCRLLRCKSNDGVIDGGAWAETLLFLLLNRRADTACAPPMHRKRNAREPKVIG